MEEYILRNKDGENVMSWNVLKVEKDFIHYLIRINYSIFSGIFNIYITKENIKRLLNFWGYIYQSKQSSTSDFEFEISDNLFLYLTKINGYIHIKTLFHENTNKYLSLKYVIDQSYLPQFIYRITKIMDNNETLDIINMQSEMQEKERLSHYVLSNNVLCRKNNLEISNVIIHKSDDESLNKTWIEFQSTIQTKGYDIKRPVSMYLYELNDFKEALYKLEKGTCESILFSPLGEFYMLEFIREKEKVHIKGTISDLLFPQSEAYFEDMATIKDLYQIFELLLRIE